MSANEFIPWAMARPRGRFELYSGEVVAMPPERARHNLVKLNVASTLRSLISKAGKDCTVFTDGMSVIIDEHTVYEPDCLVQRGQTVDLDAVTAEKPMIVVEVLCPSTQSLDTTDKLADYFQLQSVHHYLIVNPVRHMVIHHHRGAENRIETTVLKNGDLNLDPPGVVMPIAGFFEDIPPQA